MEKLMIDEQVWSALGKCSWDTYPRVNLIGIALCEEGITAIRWSRRDHKAGPLSFQGKNIFPPMLHFLPMLQDGRGIKEYFKGGWYFLVPPAWLDRGCGPDLRCREALTRWFPLALKTLFETPVETPHHLDKTWPTLLVVGCPERPAWAREQEAFLSLLQNAVQNAMPKPTYVALASFSLAACADGLSVRVGRQWTEFTLRDSGGQVLRQTAAALQMPKHGSLTKPPVVLRVNDYVQNSTAVWREARYDSWLQAFSAVCRELHQAGWPSAERAVLSCEEPEASALAEALLESGLAAESPEILARPSDALAKLAWDVLEEHFPSESKPDPTPKPKPDQKRQKNQKHQDGQKHQKHQKLPKPDPTPEPQPAAHAPFSSDKPYNPFKPF